MDINIKLLNKNAVIPTRATNGSAGYDLYASIDEEIEIKPNQRIKVGTGVALALPNNGLVALIYARSGISTKFGICLSNGVGVVDSDYRGEIIVGLVNLSDESYIIKPKERIAQMVITPIFTPELKIVDELEETVRGDGGFGHSGK